MHDSTLCTVWCDASTVHTKDKGMISLSLVVKTAVKQKNKTKQNLGKSQVLLLLAFGWLLSLQVQAVGEPEWGGRLYTD